MNIANIKWILLFGVFFFFFFLLLKKKDCVKPYKKQLTSSAWGLLLSVNCSFIFFMTLFGRNMGDVRQYSVIPFKSYYYVWVERNMELLLQIVMNVAMYIPLGILLPCCFKLFNKYRYIIFIAVLSSMSIEFTQVIFKIGLFEVDDIINNVLGAIIGVIIYALFNKLKKKDWKTEGIIRDIIKKFISNR